MANEGFAFYPNCFDLFILIHNQRKFSQKDTGTVRIKGFSESCSLGCQRAGTFVYYQETKKKQGLFFTIHQAVY
ncbi:MAG: hypothetical protein FWG24_04350 [Eggerthellaceae bacterium]|jgi:hypothetical protein|nr:hypothetical protein [Eggerthellaceae bacterium]